MSPAGNQQVNNYIIIYMHECITVDALIRAECAAAQLPYTQSRSGEIRAWLASFPECLIMLGGSHIEAGTFMIPGSAPIIGIFTGCIRDEIRNLIGLKLV
ncbi:hypothetical protein HYW83_00850 [Candidatus Peregrinibacteria bacterium]|nr:hypothetical protein [Candidatus Peregrinibacteria bacterium]